MASRWLWKGANLNWSVYFLLLTEASHLATCSRSQMFSIKHSQYCTFTETTELINLHLPSCSRVRSIALHENNTKVKGYYLPDRRRRSRESYARLRQASVFPSRLLLSRSLVFPPGLSRPPINGFIFLEFRVDTTGYRLLGTAGLAVCLSVSSNPPFYRN